MPMVTAECAKTNGGGNVVAPDMLDRMTLSVVQQTLKTVFTVTSPEGKWFAVGYNSELPDMNGTLTFVYSTGKAGKGSPALSYWILARLRSKGTPFFKSTI